MKKYFKENISNIILFFSCSFVFFLVFYLYHLPLKAVVYPFFLCILLCFFRFLKGYFDFKSKSRHLNILKKNGENISENLEIYDGEIDKSYREIIFNLEKKIDDLKRQDDEKINDMMDYYTRWVHQIKTPISSMRLLINQQDSAFSRDLSEELFKIEQYVQMALCYMRLGFDTNDFVFSSYDLDLIIKEAVRKFSNIFIKKRIILKYTSEKNIVITDKKWLTFVLEQIISNSLKYTNSGSISIGFIDDILFVEDTGIGISPEDINRVFERGYTGFNGREGKNSSGIGLYLCEKICKNMGYEIYLSSVLGKGTKVCIKLSKSKDIFE